MPKTLPPWVKRMCDEKSIKNLRTIPLEKIAAVYSKWASGEEITSEDKSAYYSAKCDHILYNGIFGNKFTKKDFPNAPYIRHANIALHESGQKNNLYQRFSYFVNLRSRLNRSS